MLYIPGYRSGNSAFCLPNHHSRGVKSKPSQVCLCNAVLSSTVYTYTENAIDRYSQVSAPNALNATGGHTAVAVVYRCMNCNYAGGTSGPTQSDFFPLDSEGLAVARPLTEPSPSLLPVVPK